MTPVTILFLILVGMAGLLFVVGILYAGYYSLKNIPNEMPAFLTNVTTTIGGILATNLGAVLGLTVAQNAGLIDATALSWYAPTTANLQVGAAYVYVFGLLLALVLWLINRFGADPNKVVSTLPELAKTFLGVVVGALAVMSGVSQS